MQPFHLLLYEEQLVRHSQVVEAVLPRYGLSAIERTLLQYENNAVIASTRFEGSSSWLRVAVSCGRSAAEQYAELHRYSERFAPEPDDARPRWAWERLFGKGSIFRKEHVIATLAPE